MHAPTSQHKQTIRRRLLAMGAVGWLALLILACTGAPGISTGATPRWACPSPMPQPYGEAGPVKEVIRRALPTAIPAGPIEYEEEPVYYEIWEQEYGTPGMSPPFPSPTPYAMQGTTYVFGQRVEVGPVHLLVDGSAGATLLDGQQLYLLDLEWVNRSTTELPVSYGEHVRLRSIIDRNGAEVSSANWGVTAESLRAAGVAELPSTIPVGGSRVVLPVLAPPGEPEVIDVQFLGQPGYALVMPSATTLPGTPTSTPAGITPTVTPPPNTGLAEQRPEDSVLLVQWRNAVWKAPGAQPCGSAGALTNWGRGDGTWGSDVPLAGVAAPPGAARVVQVALNQVGKRYRMGAKGPEIFDCSGLMTWSYAQIGVPIPGGTANQWPGLKQITAAELQPGDLIFFNISGVLDRPIDHVGMVVGDLDGDGTWDMVHAASPALGVRIDYNIFGSAFYASTIRGFRTARL